MNIVEDIERLRAQGDKAKSFFEEYQNPRPIDEAAISRLRLPTGDPLPDDNVRLNLGGCRARGRRPPAALCYRPTSPRP